MGSCTDCVQDRETNLFDIGQYVICRCYCALDDQVTADALERLESIEEKELRSGHLWSLIFGDHDRAQVSHTDMCWQPLSGTVTKPRLMHAATKEGTDRDWTD